MMNIHKDENQNKKQPFVSDTNRIGVLLSVLRHGICVYQRRLFVPHTFMRGRSKKARPILLLLPFILHLLVNKIVWSVKF